MIALPKQIFYIILCLILSWQSIPFLHAVEEVRYPGESFAKLDTFEALNLEDADKLFHKKDYKGAFAAYKAYSFEFTRSAALPYVLLRMGRCLHMVEKRNAAIKAYQDVVDYFPDDIVREIVHHILVRLDCRIPLLHHMQATPHPQQHIGQGRTSRELERIRLVSRKCSLVVLLVEQLVGILEVERLEGVQLGK